MRVVSGPRQGCTGTLREIGSRLDKDDTQIVRPMSQEELLAIIPRKIHKAAYHVKNGWLCNTPHVSPKNLTDNDSEVTCKLCLRVLGKSV